MATQYVPVMNRFLRMAVLAGVESAVQIHIDRGDDLNARDANEQTPLMLAAVRNKAAICKLLIAAGADAHLLCPSGLTALSIAHAAGALEAASAIEAACILPADSHSFDSSSEPANACPNEREMHAADYPLESHLVPAASGQPIEQPSFAQSPVAAAPPNVERLPRDDGDEFDLTGWEAEGDQTPPEHDAASSAAASALQSVLSEHQPIDSSADWDNFEAFLPDRATPLINAASAESRERLRLIFLRAIREGSVPNFMIEDLTLEFDGEPHEQAGANLRMVINDLGAETDERFEYSALHENFEVFVAPDAASDEEEAIAQALDFVDDLAERRNDPLRIYQREFQRNPLLTSEAEVHLGQVMEYELEKALDALALWPSGIGAVLEATKEVATGAKPLRWLSSAPMAELQDKEPAPNTGSEIETESSFLTAANSEEDDGAPQFGVDAKSSIDELSELAANAQLLTDLTIATRQGDSEWRACRDLLTSLGLTRAFLMELTGTASTEECEPAILFAQAMKAYRIARDQMVVANLRLVFSIAKKYIFSGVPLDDLLQEGNMGLIKAVDRYDWRKGFKLSTYASWWIRQQVSRHIADKGKTIRLPVHVYEKTQRIVQTVRAFEQRHGREPTIDEVAARVEMSTQKVMALDHASSEPLPLHDVASLDDLISEDARHKFIARDPINVVEDMQLIASVDRLLGTLNIKEANVLRMRFGIGIQDSMTLEEIGLRLNVTRERIRQIESKALRKLKHPARLDRLVHELFGVPPQTRGESEDVSNDSDGERECDSSTPTPGGSPQPAPVTQTAPPEQRRVPKPTALDRLLNQARAADVAVEDDREGDSQRIWVRTANSPANRSHKLVRKLIELGFQHSPGKGYWR